MASNDIAVLDPAATVEKLKNIVSKVALNRRHFMAALGAAGVAAGTGLVSSPVAHAQQAYTGYSQPDILNFLLNIKYLKATFYSFVTQGVDLPGSSYVTISTGQIYNQPAKVTFSGTNAAQITDMFNEMYYDDLNQLIDLRNLLGVAVMARSTINLLGTSASTGSFSAPAATVTLSGPQAIALARMLEDVRVTAFAGAMAYLTGSNLTYAAQVLAADGCHAAALRLASIQTSAPYQGTQYLALADTFLIATLAGSKTINAVLTSVPASVVPGVAITGNGIPVGSVVTAVTAKASVAPTGIVVVGSPTINTVSSISGVAANMTITGTGIPPFAYVTAASGTTITMSANATASSLATTTGIFTAGTGLNGGSTANNPALITAVASETGMTVGRAITSAGYADPAATISAVGTITVTMNKPALASSTVTLNGTLTTGSSTITVNNFITGTITGVVATTQPVIVGTSAAPVDPVSIAATVTSGSTSVKVTSVSGLAVNQGVFGTGIPGGTIITAINSGTLTITISAVPTASSTSLLICTVLPPSTLITAVGASTITLNANALSNYTGTITIPSAVTITTPNTETVTIGQGSISISNAATVTGSTQAIVVAADPYEVAPVDPGTAAAAAKGPAAVTFTTPVTGTTPALNQGFFATAGAANNSSTNPAGFAFARTFSQVLGVLYGNSTAGTYFGGFFPAVQPVGDNTGLTGGGVSGNIFIV